MTIGLALQVIALAMFAVPTAWLLVPWVMASQAAGSRPCIDGSPR